MEKFKYLIYKLTREDGRIYIGTTNSSRFKYRMYQHKISTRFKNYEFTVEIIEESEHISILEKEKYYINLYDSYKNGLNSTWSGKGYGHDSPKFTTLGYKYSDKTKTKISKSLKKRYRNNPELRVQISERKKEWWKNPENRKKFHNDRKGKQSWTKLSKNDVRYILKLYYNIKPYIENVGKTQKNGREMSYIQAFAKKYSKEYNITPQCIKRIINGETWADVQKEFKI